MHTVLAMFDGFLEHPEKAREQLLSKRFIDVTNPVDGVVYPGICQDIPAEVKMAFINGLSRIVGYEIFPTTMFARSMPEGVKSPHQVHSDRSMGFYSAHVYLSEKWPTGAGTGFYTHDTEGHRETELTNHANLNFKGFENWSRNLFCQGQFNRLLVHDSSFYHCAEPSEGFGKTLEESRLVLTCFFN